MTLCYVSQLLSVWNIFWTAGCFSQCNFFLVVASSPLTHKINAGPLFFFPQKANITSSVTVWEVTWAHRAAHKCPLNHYSRIKHFYLILDIDLLFFICLWFVWYISVLYKVFVKNVFRCHSSQWFITRIWKSICVPRSDFSWKFNMQRKILYHFWVYLFLYMCLEHSWVLVFSELYSYVFTLFSSVNAYSFGEIICYKDLINNNQIINVHLFLRDTRLDTIYSAWK